MVRQIAEFAIAEIDHRSINLDWINSSNNKIINKLLFY
jgi:hypothetical protein